MDGIAALALRMVVSLGVVLVLVAVAYFVARRRQQGLAMVGPTRRRVRTSPVASTLTVVGRAGLARGSSAIAVRFGDRVVLVGVTDGAPNTVLAEVPAHEWDREPATDADIVELHTSTELPTPSSLSSPARLATARPSFLDALRDATSRSA